MRRQQNMMNRVFAFMAMGLLLLTTNQAQAASGNGPYYATPSWDQKLPASTRFVVLTDWNSEAVLDRETGLVWEKSPEMMTRDWVSARLQCTERTTGGRIGWRLPSVHELASLVDPSVASPGPTLPPGYPFLNVQPPAYWSASTRAEIPTNAWTVTFVTGRGGRTDRTNTLHVWCVRGANTADQY